MIKKILSLFFLLISFAMSAKAEPEMADAFRADGKIYVVITVVAIVFIALAIFLVILERKLKKLEDKLNNK